MIKIIQVKSFIFGLLFFSQLSYAVAQLKKDYFINGSYHFHLDDPEYDEIPVDLKFTLKYQINSNKCVVVFEPDEYYSKEKIVDDCHAEHIDGVRIKFKLPSDRIKKHLQKKSRMRLLDRGLANKLGSLISKNYHYYEFHLTQNELLMIWKENPEKFETISIDINDKTPIEWKKTQTTWSQRINFNLFF